MKTRKERHVKGKQAMKARFPHSAWGSYGAIKTSTIVMSTQHLMAQLSMWSQETAVSQSMDGRGFPINISVQICTHPDRSQTVRRNPERLRMSSTAVIPYYVQIYSQERGVGCYMFATRLLGIQCVNHLLRRKNCTRRAMTSFIHTTMGCSLGACSWAALFPPGPAC